MIKNRKLLHSKTTIASIYVHLLHRNLNTYGISSDSLAGPISERVVNPVALRVKWKDNYYDNNKNIHLVEDTINLAKHHNLIDTHNRSLILGHIICEWSLLICIFNPGWPDLFNIHCSWCGPVKTWWDTTLIIRLINAMHDCHS